MTRWAGPLRYASVAVLITAALIRAMAIEAAVPYWDTNPMFASLPETALLPGYALLLDALVWLAVGAGVLGESLAGRRVLWRSGLLLALGVVGVALHAFVLTPIGGDGIRGEFRSLTIGSAWAAAMGGAWAMTHLARDPSVRHAVATSMLGFVVLLACVGAWEHFYEHALTVRQFDSDPAAALIAQGVEPGTTAAALFERRLRQPEATAWFGLSNIYGSFAAAGLVAWLGATIAGVREKRALPIVLAGVALVASGAALWMSHSKGAVGAALLGLAVLVARKIPWLGARLDGRWGLVALLVIAVPLVAVAARGVAGERLEERSLLFRAHYAIAALEIASEHPIVGVGPAGFKHAYPAAKVALNPEHVDSPHSLMLDWIACLGIGGMAWAALLVVWIVGVGRFFGSDEAGARESNLSRVPSVALLGVLLGVLVAWGLDRATTPAAEMLCRTLGAAIWGALVLVPIRVPRRAMAAAVLVLLVHMQIEMTGVRSTSVMAAMLLVGCGAAPWRTSEGGGRAAGRVGAGLAIVVSVGTLVLGAVPSLRWQGLLGSAAERAEAASAAGLSAPVLERAASDLEAAHARIPSEVGPLHEAARVRFVAAQGLAGMGDFRGASRGSLEAVELAREATILYPGRAGVWARLGSILSARFQLLGEQADLEASTEAWRRAAEADPLALTPAVMVWRQLTWLGRRDEARSWAATALSNDDNLRLDPLVRLPVSTRQELERSVSAGAP